MKPRLICKLIVLIMIASCSKETKPLRVNCNMEEIYPINENKPTIANGIWGTLSMMEGNCMPVIGPGSTCKHCPVKRTVRIYEYTTSAQATPSGNSSVFYDAFSTQLLREITTDNEGFFQTELPPGQYSFAVVEDGKLYANGKDAQGGINAFTHTGGRTKRNYIMTYKAVF